MRHNRSLLALSAAVMIPLTFGAPAQAGLIDRGSYTAENHFGPVVITDLPCLEGTEFVMTSTATVRGSFVNTTEGFHFVQTVKFESTLVPLDGLGPTYVERGAVGVTKFDAHLTNGGFTFTEVNNDNYFAFVDGQLVAGASIRIHELWHTVVTDADGDGVPDSVHVDFSKPVVRCPTT